MAEVSKSRLALDLEEIERQLRHSSQQPGSSRSDPLAELARIVGQDDPFRALLSGDKPAQRGTTSTDDIFGRREPVFEDPVYGRGGPGAHGLRGSLDDDELGPSQAYQDYAVALTAEEDAILRGQQAQGYAPAPHEAEIYFQDGRSYAEPESTFAPLPPRRSRKGLIAVGAILGAAVLGAGGAMMFRPGSLTGASGEPPIVKADAGPSKVVPQNPGGLDIPNQNKQIYEGTSQDGQTRVVNREEQPIDVRQAARTAGALSDAASSPQVRMSPAVPSGAAAVPSLQGTNHSAVGILGEPRRVRTVSIRPDGTIIMPEQSQPSSAPTPSPPSMAIQRMAPPAAPSRATPDTMATNSTVPQARPALPTQRPRDVTSTPVAPRSTADQAVGAPLQITSDAVRSRSDTRLAAASQPSLREPAETSAAPTKPAGFSVQLGVRNTEREGRAMFDQLKQRFAGELNGYSPFFREAEINGKTAYRVRVGPMSRDDAVSLCSRLKSSGGQCFVANN